jgi:hypothetical protein
MSIDTALTAEERGWVEHVAMSTWLQAPASREALREARALKSKLRDEDVVLLRRQGLVPLAIADQLHMSVERVVRVLGENDLEVPTYLTTYSPPARGPICPHCGK